MPLYVSVRPDGAAPPLDIGASDGGRDLPEERFVLAAMKERSRKSDIGAADRFLDDLISPPGTMPQPGVPSPPGKQSPEPTSEPDEASALVAAPPASPARASPPAKDGMLSSALKDVARGATEMPRQMLGGLRDAAQSALNLGDWIADSLEEKIPLGGVQLFDQAGSFSPGYIPAGDPRLAKDRTGLVLPDVKAATTTTGGAVRSVSQFLSGFLAAGPVLGTLAKGAPVARAAVQGAMADFTAFDAHDQRLSNLLQEVPSLANPVSAYLAADPKDGEVEGRLKNAIEGLGLGAATEGVFRAVRYVRDARRAARAADPATAAARAVAQPREAAPLKLLGDEASDVMAEWRPVEGGATPGEHVFVNFARIQTGDDVKHVLQGMADSLKGDVDAARRGVRTNAATLEAAGLEDAWGALQGRRVGQPLNAEQSVAARQLWEASAAKLLDVADTAARTGTPEDLFQFRRMMAIHGEVQREVVAARTETARALQSWQIPVGGGGAERLRSIENVLLSHGGSEAAQVMAQRVAALKNLPDGLQVLDDVAAKGGFAKTLDVFKEVWINALLSNPKTHVVNMVGNFGAITTGMVERAAAGRFSQAIGSGEVLPGEAAAQTFGAVMGIREGLRLCGRALKTGESQFGASASKTADVGFERAISSSHLAGHLGIQPDNWLGKGVDGLGFVMNTATRFLSAEDDFFKAIGYRMEVQAQALRTATHEVQDGLLPREALNERIAALAANPPENIRLAATEAATYQTFTAKPGQFVQALNKLDRGLMATDSTGAQLGSLAMRMLIPFRNTPANLLSHTFERTPLAPLMARYREAIQRGGADADIARTRMALGTMVLLGVMDLALDGHITGAGPRDPNDRGTRATRERAGIQPYSLKIGDRYFSYKRTDPIGMTLGIAADAAEIINNSSLNEDKREEIFELVAAAAASFGNQVLDKTYMSGMSDLVDTLHNPNKAAGFVEKRIAGFEPAAIGEVRRQVDPYMRYTHDLLTELRNRTPGLSQDLPIARDMWGRPRSYETGLGRTYDALSPIASRLENPEPIDREAIAHDFNLMMPDWALTYGAGVRVSLRNRPEVYSRLLELRGAVKPSEMGGGKDAQTLIRKYGDVALLPLLNGIVDGKHPMSKQYATAGGGRSGGKDAFVTKIVSDYSRAARAGLLEEFPELTGVVDAKREKRKASR